MENNLKEKEVDVFVREIVEKSLKSVSPSETSKNHVLVGGVGSSKGEDWSYGFYNPHNARFYFVFDRWSFKPGVGFEVVNSTELCLRSYCGCRIVVKKRLVEVTNMVDSKRRFRIDRVNARVMVADAVSVLELEAIAVLRAFVGEFGGVSDFRCVKVWIPDNKILHDRIVDAIPDSVNFRNDVVKKVYHDLPKNVEFSEPVFVANYFRNAGLRDFVPDIVRELDSLHHAFDRFTVDALLPLTEQIKLHLEVQRKTGETLDVIKNSLSRSNELITQPLSSSNEGLSRVRLSYGSRKNIVINSPVYSSEPRNLLLLRDGVERFASPFFSLDTISKEDIIQKSKRYRLFRARKLLKECGWGEGRW